MTYLTVPISASNLQEAAGQLGQAKKFGAEAVELRCDYLKNLTAALAGKLLAEAKKISLPFIVTCRDSRQGGAIDYPAGLRVDILIAAILAGADFIDFEYENFLIPENQQKIRAALAKHKKARLIVSIHNFKSKFGDIKTLYGDITVLYPEAIPKLVYTANHINDCFEAFDLLHDSKEDAIVLCMGEAGLSSRIIAKKLGGLVTYASLDEKSATAAGQLTVKEMKELYRWDAINEKTELYGIIGSPVAHSLSPLIHNSSFARMGLNKLYLPLFVDGGSEQPVVSAQVVSIVEPVEPLDLFMENCLSRPWLDFKGFSVTIPHKENALKFVKERGGFVEPSVERIGAVNTIIVERQIFTTEGTENAEKKESKDKKRKIAAYNTDYAGALDAITAGMGITRADLKGMPVAVIGAGGVARAVVAGLSDYGAIIKIYNRTVKRAETLAKEFGCVFAGLDDLKNLNAKLVINCTSIGMKRVEDRRQKTEDRKQKTEGQRPKTSDETPVPQEYLKKGMTVFDTVYNPAETLLLKQAKEVGAKTISGLDMFISQAVEQCRIFNGKQADLSLIRDLVLKVL